MKKAILFLFAGLLAISCSKKSDSAGGTTPTDSVDLTKASGIMSAVDSALSSMGSSGFSTSSLNTRDTASDDPRCGENGSPFDSGSQMSGSNEAYAPTRFYCLLAADLASVETLRGALAQIKSVFCSVEAAVGTIEYTEAGNDLVDSASPVTVPLTSTCWPQGLPDGMTTVTLTDMIATELDSSTAGYQYKLQFSGEEVAYTLFFFNSDGKVGFRTVEEGSAPATGGSTSIMLDTTNGVLLLNAIDDRNGAGGATGSYRRLTRVRATGTLSSAYEFTALDKLEGFSADNSGTLAPASGSNNSFTVSTVFGDATSGYAYRHMTYNGTSVATSSSACLESGDSCGSVTPLEVTGGTTSFFNTTTGWATFNTSALPLCNDNAVTLSMIADTGALGVCD